MKIPIYLTGCLALLLVASCTEDRFSQTVTLDIPEHEPLPVLGLDIVAGDTLIWPTVSLSAGILEDAPEDAPATLQLFRDGELVFDLATDTRGLNREGYRLPEALPAGAAEYEALLAVDGYPTARATQRMPAAPGVELLRYDREGGIDGDGFRVSEAIVRIQDPAGEANYYGFRIIDPQTVCSPDTCTRVFRESYSRFIDSPDPLLRQGGYHGAVVNDNSFDGQRYDLRLQFDPGEEEKVLEVWAMTEDGFRYVVSLETYELSRDNPFAEPVNVHGNIDDGYGIFMASSRVRFTLE